MAEQMIHKKKRIFVYNLFEYLAPRYDRINDWLSLGQHQRWRKRSLKHAGPLIGRTVVDFCCGSGDYISATAELVGSTGKIIGVDFSPKMLELAKTKIQSTWGSAATMFIQADVLIPPLPSNTIDLITIGFALRNVENLRLLFIVSHEILRSKGKFLALEISRQKNPLLWLGHRFYLRCIVPIFGRIILKALGPTRYLAHSIEELPKPDEIMNMLRQSGFTKVWRHTFMLGAISVYLAEK